MIHAIAAGISKTGGTDTEKLVDGFARCRVRHAVRPRHVSARSTTNRTLGAFVGKTALKDGNGVMVDWRYDDGARLPAADDEVEKLRPARRLMRLAAWLRRHPGPDRACRGRRRCSWSPPG